MSFERKVYLVGVTLCVPVAFGALAMLYWTWSIGAPASLLVGLSLGIVSKLLVGYMAWRALNGTRPAEGFERRHLSVALRSTDLGCAHSIKPRATARMPSTRRYSSTRRRQP